jgi:hypothetical protein
MSGLCKVRLPGYANGDRCHLERGHGGDFHQTKGGLRFPIREHAERDEYGLR